MALFFSRTLRSLIGSSISNDRVCGAHGVLGIGRDDWGRSPRDSRNPRCSSKRRRARNCTLCASYTVKLRALESKRCVVTVLRSHRAYRSTSASGSSTSRTTPRAHDGFVVETVERLNATRVGFPRIVQSWRSERSIRALLRRPLSSSRTFGFQLPPPSVAGFCCDDLTSSCNSSMAEYASVTAFAR